MPAHDAGPAVGKTSLPACAAAAAVETVNSSALAAAAAVEKAGSLVGLDAWTLAPLAELQGALAELEEEMLELLVAGPASSGACNPLAAAGCNTAAGVASVELLLRKPLAAVVGLAVAELLEKLLAAVAGVGWELAELFELAAEENCGC